MLAAPIISPMTIPHMKKGEIKRLVGHLKELDDKLQR
jgi:hypothetical protein